MDYQRDRAYLMGAIQQVLLAAGEVDPYAGSVLALLHLNEADGTATPAISLGSATITNDGSASAPTINAVKSASAKFGAGGWLSAGGSTGLKVSKTTSASNPYTIEFFVKPVTLGTFGRFMAVATVSGGNAFALAYGGGSVIYVDSTATNRATTGTMSTGTWYHIAICYDGTTVVVYQDGTSIYSSSVYDKNLSSVDVSIGIGCSVAIGGADGTASFDEIRWTHGINRYTSAFTVQTTEFPDR
jgi:Concanavalin A-like lectin/glucanases superfamily